MNIYDISKKAGVSIATVSRVLNGNSNVTPKTRKKVLDVIDRCGYTPNAFARGLGLNSMKSIGILCTNCSDPYLAKAVYYIEGNLREGGYNCILTCSGYQTEGKKQALGLLMAQRVDAVILVGSNYIGPEPKDNQYITDAAAQVPILLLNAELDCPNVYCTLCDDFQATKDAALALLDSGIEDILYLYHSTSFSGLRKLAGFQAAFAERGLCLSGEKMQFFNQFHEDIEGVSHFLVQLRQDGLEFHAVMASDDLLATGAVKYARQNHIRIPDELSIIGYNNSLLTVCSEPEITSVDNHLKELCSQLVKNCIGTLNGEEMPRKTVFAGKLVQKATTRFQ